MYKRLCDYIEYINEQTNPENLKKLSPQELEQLKSQLVTQIQFFQHERLIHLIVTHMFAVITIVTLPALMYFKSIPLLLLMVLEIALLFPYVIHYYHLENGTQKLYTFYDRFAGRTFGDLYNEEDRANENKNSN